MGKLQRRKIDMGQQMKLINSTMLIMNYLQMKTVFSARESRVVRNQSRMMDVVSVRLSYTFHYYPDMVAPIDMKFDRWMESTKLYAMAGFCIEFRSL